MDAGERYDREQRRPARGKSYWQIGRIAHCFSQVVIYVWREGRKCMKQLKTMWLWAMIAAAAAGFAWSAPVVSADVILHIGVGVPAPSATVYSYTYYPDQEVYYVPETGVYWWSRDGV